LTTILCSTAVRRLRLPFENGRFFDEANSTVVKEQSIFIFFLLSAVSILLTIMLAINITKAQRN
jgi:hypothetical protein